MTASSRQPQRRTPANIDLDDNCREQLPTPSPETEIAKLDQAAAEVAYDTTSMLPSGSNSMANGASSLIEMTLAEQEKLLLMAKDLGLCHQDAEDCLQETHLALIQHPGFDKDGKPIQNVQAVRRRINRNKGVSITRMRPRNVISIHNSRIDVADRCLESPDSNLISSELREAIEKFVDRLTGKKRKIARLWLDGYATNEIAAVFGWKTESTSVTLSRIRQTLWQELLRQGLI